MTLTFLAGIGVGASLVVLIIALTAELRAMDRAVSQRVVTTEPDPIESYPRTLAECDCVGSTETEVSARRGTVTSIRSSLRREPSSEIVS